MLWVMWRQHRTQVVVTAGLLAAVAGLLLVHDLRTADLAAGLAAGSAELDQLLAGRFRTGYQFLTWLPVVPALVGLFWGAPVLARELENGTVKLAWTQSVSPARWLTAKLAGLGALAGLGGLALGVMVNAWLARFGDLSDRMVDIALFGGSGVASAAWWLLAFVLGVVAGTVSRRTLSAMALTLAAYLVAFVVVGSPLFDVRDAYAEPERVVLTSANQDRPVGAVTDSSWLDASGRPLTEAEVAGVVDRLCADHGPRVDHSGCLFDQGYQQAVYHHPTSRYWRFQWTEAAILVIVAAGLGGWAVHRTTRRLS